MHVFGIDFNQVEKAGRAQTSGSDENVMTIDAKERARLQLERGS